MGGRELRGEVALVRIHVTALVLLPAAAPTQVVAPEIAGAVRRLATEEFLEELHVSHTIPAVYHQLALSTQRNIAKYRYLSTRAGTESRWRDQRMLRRDRDSNGPSDSWQRDCQIDRPVSVHSLRHTFATRLYEKTGDLYLVQRAFGHRQIATTEIYARVSDDAVRTAVGAV